MKIGAESVTSFCKRDVRNAMPATEGTLDQSWDQNPDSNGSGISCNSSAFSVQSKSRDTPERSVSSFDDDILGEDSDRSSSSVSLGKVSQRLDQATWRSLPIKENHEQFLREFMDVVIRKAVFEVSLNFQTN